MATRKTNRRTTPKTTSKPAVEQAASPEAPVAIIEVSEPLTVQQADEVKAASSAGCNVAGCERMPAHRELCPAHWMTHRGEADPVGGV